VHSSSTQPNNLKGDWIKARVNLGGFDVSKLPANFIVWSIDGQPTPPQNTLETPELRWPGSFGVKTMQVTVGGKVFTAKVDVPDVGKIGHYEWVALMVAARGPVVGPALVLQADQYADDAISWSSVYPAKPSRRNALQHGLWMAYCASNVGIGPTFALLLGSAHENNNYSSGNNWAYETTMDLHNNLEGVISPHSTSLGNPDVAAIQADLVGQLNAGDLWIWDSPFNEHNGFKATMKSDDSPIYP
jgi:hypothetical protein